MLTDSYHGMNFSIIFRKPFYVLTEVKYNLIRVVDLLSVLKLESRKEESLGFLKVVATLTEE